MMYTPRCLFDHLSSDSWHAAVRRAALCVASVVITGCAASGGASSTPSASPQVFLIASSAGLTWSQSPASGLVVKVNDFEGTNETFTWPSRALADTDDLSMMALFEGRMRMEYL
jgi:photosystem II stability/assembly factor-like uncharacterized protein